MVSKNSHIPHKLASSSYQVSGTRTTPLPKVASTRTKPHHLLSKKDVKRTQCQLLPSMSPPITTPFSSTSQLKLPVTTGQSTLTNQGANLQPTVSPPVSSCIPPQSTTPPSTRKTHKRSPPDHTHPPSNTYFPEGSLSSNNQLKTQANSNPKVNQRSKPSNTACSLATVSVTSMSRSTAPGPSHTSYQSPTHDNLMQTQDSCEIITSSDSDSDSDGELPPVPKKFRQTNTDSPKS